MGSMMKISTQYFNLLIQKSTLMLLALASLTFLAPTGAQAGNVGWAVSVGGGYGGPWRPAAYGPGWGAWGSGWGSPYGAGYGYPYAAGYYSPPVIYAPPPVVGYAIPSQSLVLAAQPQAPIWYYCEASAQYFPYVQSCPSGWQTRPAMPPSSARAPGGQQLH